MYMYIYTYIYIYIYVYILVSHHLHTLAARQTTYAILAAARVVTHVQPQHGLSKPSLKGTVADSSVAMCRSGSLDAFWAMCPYSCKCWSRRCALIGREAVCRKTSALEIRL